MDSYVSLEDRIWFLRVCHHIPFSLYRLSCFHLKTKTVTVFEILCCNQLKNTTLIRAVVRESVRKQINMAYNFVTKEPTRVAICVVVVG